MQRHQGYEFLEHIGSLLRAELRKRGAEYGLQPAHLQALGFFAQANRYSNTPAALTEYLGVTKGTASQTLLVLENLGLVKKTEDAQDRRVVRVELTRKGSKKFRCGLTRETLKAAESHKICREHEVALVE